MTDTKLDYAVTIKPAPGGGYVAMVPDLPGCIAGGATAEAVLAKVQVEIKSWIDAETAAGHPVPPPEENRGRHHPTSATDPTGDALSKAQLRVLLDKLEKKRFQFSTETLGFNQLINTMKELIEHPPPYTDAAAFRRHLADRINGACDALDKMRELLPPEMRIERP